VPFRLYSVQVLLLTNKLLVFFIEFTLVIVYFLFDFYFYCMHEADV
jgi:hypothetical protein